MDKCKFCQAELEEGSLFCQSCGKKQREISNKSWSVIGIITGAVVLLGIIAFFLVGYLQGGADAPSANGDQLVFKDNYTVENSVLDSRGAEVVATLGDQQMTNSQLQIYYWTHVLDFMNAYGAYGVVDTTKGLHEQAWDETQSYQQFFLNLAFEAWEETQILCALAAENGYVLSEEIEAELQALPEQMQQMLGEEYTSVEEMLRAQLFPGITEEGYYKYVRDYYTAYGYKASLEAGLVLTDEQAETYYQEHRAGYEENGVFKVDMKANVRHILIQPEDTASEESWASCLESAQALLDQWKQGEATEDSFAALAIEYSADGGSAADGGLYTDITPSTGFVPTFLNWTINPARQVGDTDIVQSDYGYHIMYYVSGEPMESEGDPQWKQVVQEDYATESLQAMIAEGLERWPMKVNEDKIVLGYVSLG